jgi:hypothetical protein
MAAYLTLGILGGFLLGYFFARVDFFYTVLRKVHEYGDGGRTLVMESRVQSPTSFFEQEKKAAKVSATKEKLGKIDIDTRTVVTKIDTDAIQKGSDMELGKTTAHEDTLNASVSKLAQLKGK